jgi:hypothetical protein
VFVVRFDLKLGGIWIFASPICSMDLFDKDPIVIVSKEINNDVEFMDVFCPIFK